MLSSVFKTGAGFLPFSVIASGVRETVDLGEGVWAAVDDQKIGFTAINLK
jgi:hypothetical protein